MAGKFTGVVAAMATPMTTDQEIDLTRLEELTERLIAGGVHGLAPLGSTGEFYALSAAEREAVARTVIQTTSGRVPVIVGANAGSTLEVIAYCQEAERLGADGVLLAPPYYSLPTESELLGHFRAVAEAIRIPIMLYNYPGRAGVDLTPALVERLSEVEGIDYIKESSGDATRVADILVRCGERMTVFCGSDTLALESLIAGATGWVGGVANVLPEEHRYLYELVTGGRLDQARELYYRLIPLLQLFEGGGQYTQLVKAGCCVRGLDVGPPRAPLAEPGAAERARLDSLLQAFSAPETGSGARRGQR